MRKPPKPFKREYRKIMAKGGRKRKQNAERHDCGKLVQKPEDARETVIEARQRLFGMDRDTAVRQESGTAIGRILQKGDVLQPGEITLDQYNAAREWEARSREYSFALGSRKPRSASDFGGVNGYDNTTGSEPDYIDYCERAKARYAEVRRAALESDPFGLFALEVWVLEDRADFKLLGSLRVACNAIARVIKNAKS